MEVGFKFLRKHFIGGHTKSEFGIVSNDLKIETSVNCHIAKMFCV